MKTESGEMHFHDPMSSPDDRVYLRPEVKIEPLVCGWYAWTHLVSPLQQAMNAAYRQIPLLKSFLKNPQVHFASARDPALFGGPFVDLAEEDLPRARELLSDMERRCAPLIEVAQAIKKLDQALQEGARGHSLQDFYRRPPDTLSGLVEFLYDLNHHPRLRFQEELLEDEGLSAGTQEILLSLTPEGERKFFMSTPRLESPDSVIVRLPFTDARIDRLAGMRTAPGSFSEIAGQLGVAEEKKGAFRRCFSRNPPPRRVPDYRGAGVRIRYFGHACVLIQTAATAVLLDPMLSFEVDRGDGRLTLSDLPDRLDYVVLSHNHQDHCSPEMLLQLRARIGKVIIPRNNSGCLADPSMQLALRQLGLNDVQVVNPFDVISIPQGHITSLPFSGEHVDLDVHARHGIHIEVKGRRIVFLVDSDGCDPALFTRIARRMGKHRLDALFLGMECHGAPLTWLYGPLLTKPISRRDDESRRLSGLNCERAWQAVQQLGTEHVYVYAMGQEPWLRYIMGLQYTPESIQMKEVAAFLQRCGAAGVHAEQLHISRELELAARP